MPHVLRSSFLLIVIFLSACSDGSDKKVAEKKTTETETGNANSKFGYFKPDGDSLIVPAFEIEVHLSQKAEAKLSKENETIIVSASFIGIPKDTTSTAFLESGETGIAGKDIEIRNGSIAKFENIKFSKSLYDSLSDKDIQLLINVFSGRHSSTDNLLDCGIIEDKLSKVQGKKFKIDCKLIYGED